MTHFYRHHYLMTVSLWIFIFIYFSTYSFLLNMKVRLTISPSRILIWNYL